MKAHRMARAARTGIVQIVAERRKPFGERRLAQKNRMAYSLPLQMKRSFQHLTTLWPCVKTRSTDPPICRMDHFFLHLGTLHRRSMSTLKEALPGLATQAFPHGIAPRISFMSYSQGAMG